jgi:hypothetical protein
MAYRIEPGAQRPDSAGHLLESDGAIRAGAAGLCCDADALEDGAARSRVPGDRGPAYTKIVRLLLTHRADPNKADAQGVSPLAHARQRRQAAVAALIAAAGGRG